MSAAPPDADVNGAGYRLRNVKPVRPFVTIKGESRLSVTKLLPVYQLRNRYEQER